MKIKFASWNIDTNLIRIEEGFARETHPQWRVDARMENIKNKIQDINPDILHIQELRELTNKFGEKIDSVNPLKNFLIANGYEVLVTPYNDTGDYAFKYITAWKSDRFEKINSKQLYFTESPDMPTIRPDLQGKSPEEIKEIEDAIKQHNFGEFYERCTLLTHLRDLETQEEICTFNVHCGIALNHRLKTSELLVDFVKKEVEDNPNLKIIISGDFNSFLDWKGIEQIKIITESQLNDSPLLLEASDQLYLPNGDLMPNNSSFIAFPYDIFCADMKKINDIIKTFDSMDIEDRKILINQTFKEFGIACGSHLDHIFVRNFKESSKVTIDVTPQFTPPPAAYDETTVKDYILEHCDEGPAFASDHQPLVVELIG